MEIWYNATYGRIEPVRVIKSTSFMVKLEHGRNVYKISDGDFYAPTREEAKALLVDHYQKMRDLAQSRLDHADLNLDGAKRV